MTAARTGATARLRRLEPLARTFGAATAVGLILGALIGGVGGRVAMRLLFLTSDPSVQGIESDDGFVIGEFTAATLNLVMTGALFGVVGSFTYLAVRPFLLGPLWLWSLACSAASGAVIGALVINPGGVDFTRLAPIPLAVALFIAIPALFGALCPPAMEWALRPGGWARTAPLRVVAAPLVVFLFPPIPIVLGIPTGLVLATKWALARWWPLHAAAHLAFWPWIGRVAWAGFAAFGLVLLAEDLQQLR